MEEAGVKETQGTSAKILLPSCRRKTASSNQIYPHPTLPVTGEGDTGFLRNDEIPKLRLVQSFLNMKLTLQGKVCQVRYGGA
jgi:hypothetical protein